MTSEQTELNVASFEQVWRTIRDTYWDKELEGLDWAAIHEEYLPRIEQAATMAEVQSDLSEMLALLGKSHFGIFPSDLYADVGSNDPRGDGISGLDIRVVDDRVLVVTVDPGSCADRAGMRPGWEILAIDDKLLSEIAERLADEEMDRPDRYLVQSVRSRLRGAVGENRDLCLIDGDGAEVVLSLTLTRDEHRLVHFGNLPPMRMDIDSRRLTGDLAYFRFSIFLDPPRLMSEFNTFMAASRDCPGVIIDLRGNPGGIGGLATGMSGWFVSERKQHLGKMITRTSSLNFMINPRPRPYEGALVILIDELSGSTSEILAGGLQELGRAQVVGRRSAGAALPSNVDSLPNGDGFQYAVANFVSGKGVALEGIGVIPDIDVGPTPAALLEGQDLILSTAIDLILSERGIAIDLPSTGTTSTEVGR
ncbi:MAG: hypothetical protein GY835_16775 [bacterium]|nr:hypothetical protein [bacterium]